MAILIDFSQLMFQCSFEHKDDFIFTDDDPELETKTKEGENVFRHIVLSEILSINQRFSQKYGEIIICCDGLQYWRKQIFPYYKASRKQKRAQSPLNWHFVFSCFEKMIKELDSNSQFKVIRVNEAEADDVIAILTKHFWEKNPEQKILIVSGDEDYCQLQKYSTVEQFSTRFNKFIKAEDCEGIQTKVLKGDYGDGIPSVLNDDNIYVEGIRATPLRKTMIEKLLTEGFENCSNAKIKQNWERNNNLINLDRIPKYIESAIIDCYNKELQKNNTEQMLYDYLINTNCEQFVSEMDMLKPY